MCSVLNSPHATEYRKELDNQEATMNEGNYPNRPWVTDPTELDSSNAAWVLKEPPHNVGTQTGKQMSLVKDYEEP